MSVTLYALDERWTAVQTLYERRVDMGWLEERQARLRALDERQVGMRWLEERRCTMSVQLRLLVSTATISSGEIGDVDNGVVDVTWSGAIASPSNNYAAGMAVTVNGTPVAILSATLQPGSQVIRLVLATAADADDVVAVAYTAGAGDLVDGSGLAVASAASGAVNNVGTHLYFDQEDDLIHLVTSL